MSRVLVTGAAGFIGSHLCESLLSSGCEVRGLDSFTTFYDPDRKLENIAGLLAEPAFELVPQDLLTVELAEVLDGVDVVAHLAGEPGVSNSWGQAFQRYIDRNVMATQRLLEAVHASRVPRLVYASSSSVYGTETDALRARGEPRPASPYGVSKLAAETLVGAYASAHGIESVSLRYFSVYGPRQRPDMAAYRFIESMLDGRALTVFGDGSQARDFTYVGDVVDATRRALFAELPRTAVLDIASCDPVQVGTLIRHLQALLGVDAAAVETRGERRGDVPRTEGRIDAARHHLGWTPRTDLQAGLRLQVEWQCARRDVGRPASVGHEDSRALASVSGGQR